MNFGIAELREMIASMSKYPDMDYSNYTLSFMARRLSFIFFKEKVRQLEKFIQNLDNFDFRERVKTLMCVEVTEMFREPAFWRTLRSDILTNLPFGADTIWLPVASGGEEAYSLSILLNENRMDEKYKVLCSNPTTELNEQILKGILSSKHKDISQTNYRRLEDQDNFSSYITQFGKDLVVGEQITKNIECITGNFADCLPKNRNVGIILFRNIALYYNSKMAQTAYKTLVEQLMPGGYFIIGIKEALPKSIKEELIVVDEADRIYQKPILKQKQNYVEL